MQLNENARIDTSQIDDQRGSSGGGGGLGGIPIPIGRGKGGLILTLVVVVASMLLGGGFGLNALNDGGSAGDNTALREKCAAETALDQLDCRNTLFVNSIQDFWQAALPERFGKPYQQAQTTFFSQAVTTGCGSADSGVGPFYCPADRKIYIDLTFYRVLADQLGANGEFAQPYVLAHEYGHHVQTLLGTEAQMRRAQQRDPDAANALSVKLELQADCYAGAWAKNATGTDDATGVKIFVQITEQDIKEGLDTAAAIGDDTIQKRSGGSVDKDAFTHGSAAQRQQWFNQGFSAGDPTTCDTFGNAR